MPALFYIVLGAAMTAATAFALGLLLLRRVACPLSRLEHYTFAYVTGSAVLSLLVFTLSGMHLVHKGVLVAMAVLSVALCWRAQAWRREWVKHAEGPAVARMLFLAFYAAFGVLYFINAAAPEISPDGSTYHLGIVSRYYREHGFVPVTTNWYASLTQAVEMLFLFAWSMGRHSAAALVHWTFLMVLPLAMLAYARRHERPVAGAVAGLLVFAAPVSGITGTSAYTDVALACVLFTGFATARLGLWVPAGLLAGFALAIKYTAFLALPVTLAHVRRWRAAAIVTAAAALMIVPWLARNVVYTGNPVAPFFNRWFPNPYFYPDAEAEYGRDMRDYGVTNQAELPLEVTVRGEKTGGFFGPVWLLAPLGLLAVRSREGRALVAVGLLYAATYPLNIGTRFLLPAAPFLSLALGFVLARWQAVALAMATLHVLLSWPALTKWYCAPYAWRLEGAPVREALRLVPEEVVLAQRSQAYIAARMIEGSVPPDEKVFTFSTSVTDAYTSREIVVSYQSAFGRQIRHLLWTPLTHELRWLRWQQWRFPPRPVRRIRVQQNAAHPLDIWSVSELRVFSAERELRGTDITAHPNGHHVRRAFDNRPNTRWSAHQPLEPGQSIELRLPSPQTVDSVRLESTRDQYQARVSLQLDDEDLGPPQADHDGPDNPDARAAAAAQLLREGIRYILIEERDFAASDYRTRAAEWRFRLLDSKGRLSLYRIE